MRLSRQRREAEFEAIKYFHNEKKWSISWMCNALGVSRSGFYKWFHREKSNYENENEKLAELIIEYDERFGHILGYRRMTIWINHFNHTNYGKKRVHRIMKKLNIHAHIRRKKKKNGVAAPEIVAENKLRRDFYADKPNTKWVTDITEFKVPDSKKKIYLSAILDLYDRSPVAYVISNVNNNKLVFDTYDKAIELYPDAKPLFHSDRGFQYTSCVFKDKIQKQGMIQSMSRVGHCIDNGPVEGFWGIIKTEMYSMYKITDEKSLRDAINKYIKFYYEERIQERYDCKTPKEIREEALSGKTERSYPISKNKRIQKYKEQWAS